jgi:hypothetical protein
MAGPLGRKFWEQPARDKVSEAPEGVELGQWVGEQLAGGRRSAELAALVGVRAESCVKEARRRGLIAPKVPRGISRPIWAAPPAAEEPQVSPVPATPAHAEVEHAKRDYSIDEVVAYLEATGQVALFEMFALGLRTGMGTAGAAERRPHAGGEGS